MWLFLAVLKLILVTEIKASKTVLYAQFNNAGVSGNITFMQDPTQGSNVTISVHLFPSSTMISGEPRSFAWGIYSFPVFYDSKAPCASSELGTTFHDLSKRHGSIVVPMPDGQPTVFVDPDLQLRGFHTIWGRSLLLRSTNYNDDLRACANIASEGDTKTVEVTFSAPVAGTVIFRQGELGETTIFANVFHTAEEYTPSSNHEWKILATDILDNANESSRRRPRRCDYLQVLFDPNNVDDTECTTSNHEKCKIGDMTSKHSGFAIGATNSRYSKRFYVDTNLPLSAMEGQRTLYLVLYEKDNAFRIMACARMRTVLAKEVKAHFSHESVQGHILFSQSYRTQPTVVTVQLKNLWGKGSAFRINEFPVPLRLSANDDVCSESSLGQLYNPFELNAKDVPAPGTSSSDQYPVGDLSGKFGLLDAGAIINIHLGIHADFNLPLFGIHSVIGRSVVIFSPEGKPWICSTIGYPSSTRVAIATFVFPIAGQIIMRQSAHDPLSETTVFGQLHYVDGSSINDTFEHRWDVHEKEPGRDFYNWTKRCESTGDHFNPFNVGSGRQYERYCHPENPFRCAIGDFTGKHKRLTISSNPFKIGAVQNKIFYTDVQLPLSGPNKILGKGLVIHDDAAPPHRGDRLACSGIRIRHPVKAAVRHWLSGPAVPSNVSGVIRFEQEADTDVTEVSVDISGLKQAASGYHVHEVWVPRDREFPCTQDSVYDHFNPFLVNVSLGPAPGVGSDDQYEVGDLSGKEGTLDGKESRRDTFLDSNLPLHGPYSIVGRSVVVHKKTRNFRWTCGTVYAEYPSDTSREVIGIASFDKPGSFLEGFIRLRQLEYADGGRGDTWIEVDLRHPGKLNRNVTKDHAWAVFVNQVAHDALERVESSRCIAAGYRWNPYNIGSNDDNYKIECAQRNPFRCQMGDLSGRHGNLIIGSNRKVFTDVNLPLVGNYSVMGRSMVVFAKDGSPNKISCANIVPDIHLVRHVSVKRHPGFTASRFIDHMRELLETKDWLVVPDLQSQREILDGLCIQMTVHFYGPDANRLQIEFSNLINFGSLQKNTRTGNKMLKTHYKPCRNLNDINGSSRHQLSFIMVLFTTVMAYIFLKLC